MFKRLFTLTFAISLITTLLPFGQDSNQLEKHIPNQHKEQVLNAVDTQTYQALSASQKSKPTELPNSYITGTFSPVGIARNQISKIGYSPKNIKYNKQSYEQQPTRKDIESYAQHKKTTTLVLNTPITNQITAILAN